MDPRRLSVDNELLDVFSILLPHPESLGRLSSLAKRLIVTLMLETSKQSVAKMIRSLAAGEFCLERREQPLTDCKHRLTLNWKELCFCCRQNAVSTDYRLLLILLTERNCCILECVKSVERIEKCCR